MFLANVEELPFRWDGEAKQRLHRIGRAAELGQALHYVDNGSGGRVMRFSRNLLSRSWCVRVFAAAHIGRGSNLGHCGTQYVARSDARGLQHRSDRCVKAAGVSVIRRIDHDGSR
jgi:hypothetical protein